MENNVKAFNKIYKQIETKVNEELLIILHLQSNPEDLLKKRKLRKLEVDVCNKLNICVMPDNIKQKSRKIGNQLGLIGDEKLHVQKKLQQCIFSNNEDAFRKALKIYYQVISTPATTALGYLSLLKSLDQLFSLNKPEKVRERTIILLKLLLRTQSQMLRNTTPSKSKTVEKVISLFIIILSSHPVVLKTLSQLDVKAVWFQKFTHSAPNRKIVLEYFKKTTLIDNFLTTIRMHPYTDEQLIHSINLLKHYFSWRQAFSIFPYKTNEQLTLEDFVVALLTKSNSLVDTASNSLKQPLEQLLENLFVKRPNLIVNSEVRKKLFEPLLMQHQPIYITVGSNINVLNILNNICKTPNASKYLLHAKSLKSNQIHSLTVVEKHNVVKIVANLTIMCIRNFIYESEKQTFIDHNIFTLVDCCMNLLAANLQMFSSASIVQLVQILQDFYETACNYSINTNYHKLKIAAALCTLIQLDYGMLKILEKSILKEIAVVIDTHKNNYCNLVLALSHSKDGKTVIENIGQLIIQSLLSRIWATEKSNTFETYFNEFLQVIAVLNNKFTVIEVLLNFENESEMNNNQEKPVTLHHLVKNSLNVRKLDNMDIALGLQCIQILVTNLDVLLYLEHNYKLQENLLEIHSNNSKSATLIDEYSWLRHCILLSIRHLSTINVDVQEKLLNQSEIVPSTFNPRTCNELQKFLRNYKKGLHDINWFSQVRKSFRISCKNKYKVSTTLELMNQVFKLSLINVAWTSSDAILHELFPEDYYGVTLVIRYGIQNNLLHSSMQNEANLILLLKQARAFVGYKSEEFLGFDWLVAAIFLISGGKIEKCKQPIINISTLPVAPVIWPLLTYASDQKHTIFEMFYRQLEVILNDKTRINAALKNMDVSAKYIAEKWLNQCFLGVLDFKELCNFISLIVLYPPEYLLYYLVAMFKHCSDDIFDALQAVDSVEVLRITATSNFLLSDYFDFMDSLNRRYRNCLNI